MAGLVLVAMRDRVVLGRIQALTDGLGLSLEAAEPPQPSPAPGEPAAAPGELPATPSAGPPAQRLDSVPLAVVVELELPHAVDWVGRWRQRWPTALIAGSVRFPDQELWHGAIAAGADLVANRGALVNQLQRVLEARLGGGDGAGDVVRLAVRLMERTGDGLIGRLPDAPGGSVVIFRVGDRLHAVRDECPHAGASLADGDLTGTIITCPRHGSQFDVATGARERGPSDFPIRTYRVVADGAATYVEVPR